MKKSLLVLTAALTFGSMASAQTAPAASAPQVPAMTDVPAGHWAKDAIDRLVSKGIILGYPDGTFRGTQTLTRYEASVIIARLLDQINTGAVAAPTGEDATALQNAVQELSADLAALGVRVSDLEENSVNKDDFARLEARVEELAGAKGDGDAVANIQSQIDALTARADDYDTMRADVDDNASSIAALNDLTVLLNQDILDLQDRVSATEAAQANFVQRSDFDNLNGKVTAIDTRVATLENAPKFSVSGSMALNYGSISLNSDSTAGHFDIDRLNANNFIGSYFSDDTYCGRSVTAAIYEWHDAYKCVDTANNYGGIDASVTIGATGLKTANGQLNVDAAHATLKMQNGTFGGDLTKLTGNTLVNLSSADAQGSVANGVKFSVRFDNGNDSNSKFKFNDYLFNNDADTSNVVYRRGVVATIDGSAVSTLNPQVTIVGGSAFPQTFSGYGKTFTPGITPYTSSDGTTIPSTVPLLGGYFGVRMTVNPMKMGTIGLSYARGNDGTAARRDAVGVDADMRFGPASVQGVFVSSNLNSLKWNADNAEQAGYVKFGVENLAGLTLHANYRYIDSAYEDGIAGMSANDAQFYFGMNGNDDYTAPPFGPNENGFGVDGKYTLGPVKLVGYVDSFTAVNPELNPNGWNIGTARNTSAGGSLGTSTIRGLSATGFYNYSAVGSVQMSEAYYNDTAEAEYGGAGAFDGVPNSYGSNFGVQIHHDGKAADALVKGLNADVTYQRIYDDNQNVKQFNYNLITAYAAYNGKFGVVTVKPFARVAYFNNPNQGAAVSASNDDYRDGSISNLEGFTNETLNYTSYKTGIQISTDPIDTIAKPSVFGGVAYRSTSFSTNLNGKPSTEMFGNVGLTLNQFIFPSNKLSVGYSYYEGHGLTLSSYGTPDVLNSARDNSPFSATKDRMFRSPNSSYLAAQGTVNEKLSGIYGQWEGWDVLKAAYGVYKYTDMNNGKQSTAQAFKVSMNLKF